MKRAGTIMVVGLVGVLASCGQSSGSGYALRGEPIAPGADARINISPQEGGNQEVDLTVENLAPPQRIDESATSYAVWLQPSGREPVHLGNLMYNADARSGGIRAVTPHQQFEVFVTPEQVSAPLEPTGPRVFQWRTPVQ